jgi:hypothetical protein
VWKYHSHCFAFPQALPKLLLSVPWEDPSAVKQAHRILETWDRLSPFTALQVRRHPPPFLPFSPCSAVCSLGPTHRTAEGGRHTTHTHTHNR